MQLAAGTRLGVYEILSPIGSGGMGDVYRARDTKLNRVVAVKALPEHFGEDPDRLARFEREAQLLAALVHPHIATIHGIVEADGSSFIVLEYVDGQSLAERLRPGPLSVDEALAIARQIADALQAAHRRGIIHRDLKPANVMLTSEGRVKVLDFGLGKFEGPPESGQSAVQRRGLRGSAAMTAESPTFTSPVMTQSGMIIGTAPYMAPEQAKGAATDRRTDIWAFGCVLYEMLTGRRPFEGEDLTEVIAAVVRGEPAWNALPSSLPPVVGIYLRRCLEKNPNDRVQDIGDVKLALEGAFDVPAASAAPSRLTRLHYVIAAAAGLAIAAAAAAAAWVLKPEPTTDGSLRRFEVLVSPGPLAIANTNTDLTITPDGRRIIYLAGEVTNRTLYVRALDSLTARPLRVAIRGFEPIVSPDSRWVAYNDESDYTLRKISLDGGPPLMVANTRQEVFGASWGDDGSIVYATSEGLWRIPAGQGEPESLAKPDRAKGEMSYRWPHFLPGAEAFVYTNQYGARPEESAIAAFEMRSKKSTILLRGGTSPRYSSTGHLVYGIEGTLRAVRFDPDRLAVSGDPQLLVENVITKSSGCVDFALARDGTLVYISGASGYTPKRLVWVDRAGSRRPLNTPARAYGMVRISPDGTRLALEIRDDESDVWIWDIAREQLRRLTSSPAFDGVPVWTSDSRTVLFGSMRNGLLQVFRQHADGAGATELVTPRGPPALPLSIAPDGTVLVRQEGRGAGEDILLLPPGSGELKPLLTTDYAEGNSEVSPDGRWLAYQSNEAGGTVEVFVRPYPDVQSGRWQVSNGGGVYPVWSSGGTELYYVAADGRLMRVPVSSRGGFSAGPASVAVQPPFYAANIPRTFDITRDGKQILLIEDAPGGATPGNAITVVLNWTGELRRLLPQ